MKRDKWLIFKSVRGYVDPWIVIPTDWDGTEEPWEDGNRFKTWDDALKAVLA